MNGCLRQHHVAELECGRDGAARLQARAHVDFEIAAIGGKIVGQCFAEFRHHALVAEIALRRLALDQLWWMVTPGNPLKSTRELAPLGERLHLSEQIAKNPKIKVTAFEATHHIRFTADTLALVKARNPGVDFVWIMPRSTGFLSGATAAGFEL